MTDQELLDLAARAAGIEVTDHPNNKFDQKSLVFISNGRNWNPLTDPGDALRLAQTLCFYVDFDEHIVWHGHKKLCDGDPIPNNPLAATMRAITTAAAEIGRRMQG